MKDENSPRTVAEGFELLYEDGPLLVINKSSGILTQAPAGIDSLEHRVRQYLIRTANRSENAYVGIPHRLDRPASGVILFCKHSRSSQRISEQFESREVEKTYWALTQGTIKPDEGTWTDYMRKIPGVPQAELALPIDPLAREAVLHYRVLDRFSWGTWLEIRLETGRMHQIRLQASVRGFALLGDKQYGSNVPFGPQYEDERRNAIALHARNISLMHPMSREPIRFEAPVPPAWDICGK